MPQDWQALTRLIGDSPVEVERVRCTDSGVAIEGRFELPALARLAAEDQTFVAAFVQCHGSIKQMEKYFGVSYPTIKSRLNRISSRLPFVEVDPPPTKVNDVLGQVERGELTVAEAVERLREKP
jgi:hypothetical protein